MEVVDALLDYNLLLGRNGFYIMMVVSSIVFRTLQFPHLGNIVTINQLDFCSLDVTTPTANNIPMLGQSPPPYQSVGVGMVKDSTLMGVFPSTHPSMEVENINMVSTNGHIPRGKEVVGSSSQGPCKALYDVVQSAFDVHSDYLHLVASYPYLLPY